MEILAVLRQWSFPRELRIRSSPWPAGLEAALLATVEELLALRRDPRGKPARAAAAELGDAHPPAIECVATVADTQDRAAVYAALATGLWRLRRKLRELEGPELRGAMRHLEGAWDTLADLGIEVHDHDGQPLPRGGLYELEVLAYQPTAGLARETVVETIKPTVQAGGTRIQMGEVIVGTPPPLAAGEKPEPEPEAGGAAQKRARKAEEKERA